ncbi:MAG: MBL fold metallo-hydrolase [Moraxellaceae bacterium]|nr:MAG: MBL fold metallo-hydrolase [Moraxellaceae bacterium]
MRFASIGSGSEGNGTLISCGETLILLDCGFSAKETVRRLREKQVEPEQLTAILVTHEHADHIKGVSVLSSKYNVPVYLSWGTFCCKALRQRPLDETLVNVITPHEKFVVGDIQVQSVPVPHDAREPIQFIFSNDKWRLGVITDTGSVTPHIISVYGNCDALLLECNHDSELLANGPYPYALKRRVAGDFGHLNNQQAALLLKAVYSDRMQHLIVTHVSQKNNHPDRVKDALVAAIQCNPDWIQMADQACGFDWLEFESKSFESNDSESKDSESNSSEEKEFSIETVSIA